MVQKFEGLYRYMPVMLDLNASFFQSFQYRNNIHKEMGLV
jgi:hypothetical protein